MLRLLLLIALATPIAIAPAAGQSTRSTITKREVRSLATREVKRRVLGQLAEMLVIENLRREGRPVSPLRALTLHSLGRPTRTLGLCTTDLVWLDYEAVGKPRGAATESAIRDFTVRRYFHVLVLPAPQEASEDRAEWPGDRQCARLNFWKDEFFRADDPALATQVYRAKEAALKALSADAALPVTCERYFDEKEESCASIIVRASRAHLSEVSACTQAEALDWGMPCYRAGFDGDRILRIGIKGGAVARMHLESPIVLIHEWTD